MLNYQQRGQGPDVILVHGLFGSLDNLGNLGRALEDAFTVTTVDLRNHGKSFHSEEMSLAAMAGDLLGLMDQLGIEKAHLVGHSLGGKVVMQLALNHPERVDKLVVADIAPVTYRHSNHDSVFAALTQVDPAQYQSRKEVEAAVAQHILEPGVRQFILKNLQKGDDGYYWRLNVPVLAHRYPDILQGPQGRPFSGPTLFIKGSESDYLTGDHAGAVQSLFPTAKLKVISGTGHWLHAEKPLVFNKLVRDFLS
ncbi:alpha/beta fold hydrolase [Gallaecimonas kandeliae]|uniref:alpha/beta fold hydrolase n=1 Tax=Gallaecimonas kandeliae TaxID=3029055 RepID=UPI0026491A72|nr:alpha/beta fold hydrolase [Gallaecimonas kandeliae]WKE67195.1 alpha/beta fold hydrolase [Gallaecimonas kandeliae]